MRTVRWLAGASLAALAALWGGCGGGEGGDLGSTSQPHVGGENDCECKVTGGGVDFLIDDVRFTFGLNALPREGDDHGHITLQVHDDGGDKFFGRVTDIVSCEITEEGGIVQFGGTLVGNGAFTVIVEDLGEPGRDDTISFEGGGFAFGPIELGQGGNIQVHKPKPGECPDENDKDGNDKHENDKDENDKHENDKHENDKDGNEKDENDKDGNDKKK